MAKYTVISDIGKGILNMLRDKLVPEPIDKAESIGICEPKERGGYIVGIHPYDIKEDTSGRAVESNALPDGSVQDHPAMIEIYYMISVSSKAELEAKAMDEAKIVGRIIQVIKDNPIIPSRYMPNNIGAPIENVPISSLPINMEEKVKIWTMFGESYKMSVFYVVGPVAIDSENIHKPRRRVERVYLNSKQYAPESSMEFLTRIKEEDIDDEYTQKPDEEDQEEENEEDGFDSGMDNDTSDLDSNLNFGDDESSDLGLDTDSDFSSNIDSDDSMDDLDDAGISGGESSEVTFESSDE